MKQETLLIIEDDENIASLVKLYAEKAGFRTIVSFDGLEGLEYAKKIQPDCIVLDLMLPGLGGVEILKQVRMESKVPIIILTAKEEEVEMLVGLELGADDYVTKPFKPNVLLARIKAVMRRTSTTHEGQDLEKMELGGLVIDPKKFSMNMDGSDIDLSAIEMKLITILASHPGQVFSREKLMEKIYEKEGKFVFDRTIDVHIANIRKKLRDDPKKPKYIESVFGVGYKFKEQ
jgi:DNA-binding response OmpR family regulator